ncbi:peptidoglycan DD-metalloendopeptidase family protein [Rhodococcus opacus]|uniref:Peptidoglycan DD-metalloendopeptidase family protein n=1 Tax=Rhodococcus opacus TaxID=37919 RepID=A0AAX3YR24_RHOOP|nr:peptidoglycan DD-metalloendopeptidase family protein [Rhodococcus opacus]MCZ4587694.1 peptidoglycan DD-metalloendopeptidase family protein [Rhodococcus opacus]WLF51310.1 peptidoglycan DD-metalloendopeptidase family protein [Rhodococcus opacus]
MWVVAGKVAAKAATKVVAKKAAGGQDPKNKKKRWPLYVAILGAIAAFFAVSLLLVGNMITAFVAAITGTTTVASTDCGVDRGRVSAFGSAGGSLSGVRAGSLAIPMAAGTYTISSGWGMRDGGMHNGSDFAAPAGTPIYAAADGEVTIAGPMSGYGHVIVVRHTLNGQRVDTLYGHMFADGVLAKVGDKVRGGQHIANIGNDGDSSGAHLHFSLHPGGYTDYNSGIDPMPWLTQDLPADSSRAAAPPEFTPIEPNAPPGENPFVALTAPAAEMVALPAAKGTESGMQVDGVRVMRAAAAKFPAITTIGGLRPGDTGDHGSGRAVDIMIPDYKSPDGIKLGDDIVEYFQLNVDFFHIDYLIWQQRLWQNGSWSAMEDRGDDTENHLDHVHVSLAGGGAPNGDTRYGTAPGVTPNSPPAILAADTLTSTLDCVTPSTSGGGGVADGSVPEKYRAAVIAAGSMCPEIKPPLIAGQLEQESGFQEQVTSAGDGVNDGGAEGMAQFMPGTWATMGVDSGLDKDGRPESPNAPDPFNPFDAIAAQGKYMCYIVDQLKPHVASGKVRGDIVDLALAGYNAGEGAVIEYGGIPPFGQTQAYVPGIRARMAKYEANIGSTPGTSGGGPAITVAGSPFARATIEAASRQQGLPYVWGGGGPDGPTAGQGNGELGFDCSGLVLYAVAQASGNRTLLPRTTWGQVETGTAVSKENIQPGDAVYSNNTGHVAIWLGDGKVLEAQTFGVPVGVHPFDLNNAENIRRFG